MSMSVKIPFIHSTHTHKNAHFCSTVVDAYYSPRDLSQVNTQNILLTVRITGVWFVTYLFDRIFNFYTNHRQSSKNVRS
jgi:hypothetical protein